MLVDNVAVSMGVLQLFSLWTIWRLSWLECLKSAICSNQQIEGSIPAILFVLLRKLVIKYCLYCNMCACVLSFKDRKLVLKYCLNCYILCLPFCENNFLAVCLSNFHFETWFCFCMKTVEMMQSSLSNLLLELLHWFELNANFFWHGANLCTKLSKAIMV